MTVGTTTVRDDLLARIREKRVASCQSAGSFTDHGPQRHGDTENVSERALPMCSAGRRPAEHADRDRLRRKIRLCVSVSLWLVVSEGCSRLVARSG